MSSLWSTKSKEKRITRPCTGLSFLFFIVYIVARLSVGTKDSVPAFGPTLPEPCIFEKGEYFRQFLFHKRKHFSLD